MRRQLADKLGVSERTVRRAENLGENVLVATEIDTIGMKVADAFIEDLNEIAVFMRRAASQMRAAQSQLTMLANSSLGYPERRLDVLHEMVSSATAAVLDAIPTSLCPYCKGLPGLIDQCATCLTLGYVGDGIRAHCDRELLDADDPVVIYQGKKMPADRYIAEHTLPKWGL